MIKIKPITKLAFLLLLSLNTITISAQNVQNTQRTILSFDNNWRFFKGDSSGAESSSFDDSDWRKPDLPHDWSIEGPYDKANPTSRGGGYLPAGVGWYRKTFILDQADPKKKYFIEFDGIMANSDVWINGFHLGRWPYGYTSFSYDLTGHLKTGKGETNIIAVRADNSVQPASRYYAGAGIYRHVRLVITNPVHIEQWGVYISASQVAEKKAVVKIQSSILNETSVAAGITLNSNLVDQSGKTIKSLESKETVPGGKPVIITQTMEL
jgi:beta-galactosidase